MNRWYLRLLSSAVISILLSTTLFASTLIAQTTFSRTNIPPQVKVTAASLNVRSGPSAAKTKVGLLYKNQIVDCIGKMGSWWVIHLENDTVGLVSGNYAKPYYPPNSAPAPVPKPVPTPTPTPTPAPTPVPTPAPTPEKPTIGVDEQKMLDLINAERSKVGVAPLKTDTKVMEVAKLKADDMVKNNYFSHTSPTYGSPFDMLKKFGVTYQTAGENIAGNSSVEAAHNALMQSEGHRKNILNSSYNYIGIGICPSPTYGKVFVQMFIGR
ncbi:CAP domain-containing protein [Desulfosporosinus sp. BICA1-9]|uniref:CAP domain-containing protein n=1 Tax=Desulfosporosinus sp. BICA1-9 TaxID=1531958 RepID=UPI0005F26FE0|nr:CAP domain-containing protein [Desulfosporosinus sp. BICA1-9]KJS48181.1 MAG: serine protease [Peptococcaceae bacterium BRH_c23]KJS87884.1 MAG: serine protease [Desulfosporosinus sp. BICA1-9]HBW37170.1 serine protease [Desulfosporosinus sp.]